MMPYRGILQISQARIHKSASASIINLIKKSKMEILVLREVAGGLACGPTAKESTAPAGVADQHSKRPRMHHAFSAVLLSFFTFG